MAALRTIAYFFGALTALFAVVVGLINIIELAESNLSSGFNTNFPNNCNNNQCISPYFNATWCLGILSGFTMLFGFLCFIHCIRDTIKSEHTAALEKKEFFVFSILGLMILGQAATVGFSGGIGCFFAAILFLLVFITEGGARYSRI